MNTDGSILLNLSSSVFICGFIRLFRAFGFSIEHLPSCAPVDVRSVRQGYCGSIVGQPMRLEQRIDLAEDVLPLRVREGGDEARGGDTGLHDLRAGLLGVGKLPR